MKPPYVACGYFWLGNYWTKRRTLCDRSSNPPNLAEINLLLVIFQMFAIKYRQEHLKVWLKWNPACQSLLGPRGTNDVILNQYLYLWQDQANLTHTSAVLMDVCFPCKSIPSLAIIWKKTVDFWNCLRLLKQVHRPEKKTKQNLVEPFKKEIICMAVIVVFRLFILFLKEKSVPLKPDGRKWTYGHADLRWHKLRRLELFAGQKITGLIYADAP